MAESLFLHLMVGGQLQVSLGPRRGTSQGQGPAFACRLRLLLVEAGCWQELNGGRR